MTDEQKPEQKAAAEAEARATYQRAYFQKKTKVKRAAAAAIRREEKLKVDTLSDAARARMEADIEASHRAKAQQERAYRAWLIISELTPPLQPDAKLPDGSSYWTWFMEQMELFIADVAMASHGNFARLYHDLSMTEEGRLVLAFHSVPPMDPAPTDWGQMKYDGQHNTFIDPEQQRHAETLERIWNARRGVETKPEVDVIAKSLEDREGLEHQR